MPNARKKILHYLIAVKCLRTELDLIYKYLNIPELNYYTTIDDYFNVVYFHRTVLPLNHLLAVKDLESKSKHIKKACDQLDYFFDFVSFNLEIPEILINMGKSTTEYSENSKIKVYKNILKNLPLEEQDIVNTAIKTISTYVLMQSILI